MSFRLINFVEHRIADTRVIRHLKKWLKAGVLEAQLYPPSTEDAPIPRPDISALTQELSRPHVTLELLWREYHVQYPDGMSHASFYRYYQAHRR